MAMDERKNRVLQAIIEDYVATAEPVGSRTIARKYHLGVSSATIRNEMSDLEELGYIEQPHTSAGRVPSDRGYRYFVDRLMEHKDVSASDVEVIRRTFSRRIGEIEQLIRETARMLSETTHYTSLVSAPQTTKTVFKELHLMPLGGDRALLVWVTDAGIVENRLVEMPVEITMLELQRIAGVLNEHLRGQSMASLGRSAVRQLHDELKRYGALLEQTLESLTSTLHGSERQRIYLGGTTNILAQPEFRDLERVRGLFGVLEKDDLVHDVLNTPEEGPVVSVSIGEEIRVREMHDCSVITATYSVGDRTAGRVGVLGPKRMEYARVIAVVEEVARRLSENLQRHKA